jgi:hypothetical protein
MQKRLFLAAVTFAGLAATAYAGAEVNGKATTVEVATPSTIVAEAGQTVRDQRRIPGQILRCWQYGRLVYEGSGFKAGADKNGVAVQVPRAGEGEQVTVLDLKQGMCILSTH